jgi:tetrahydromethanopterin S-methyltransferase subunit G
MMEALKMETPMTEWNDDRLDELNGRMKEGFAEVDKRFDKVDARFDRLESEVKEGFAKVDREMKEGFARVENQFAKADDRFATREELSEVTMELRRLNDRFDRFLFIFLGACVGLVGSFLVAAFSLAFQG